VSTDDIFVPFFSKVRLRIVLYVVSTIVLWTMLLRAALDWLRTA
jgi:hypothetical protein